MLCLYRHSASGANSHVELSWQDCDAYEALLFKDTCTHGSSPMDMDNVPYNAVPSEEGHDISHEGGEHEGFGNIQVLLSQLGYGTRYAFVSYSLAIFSSMANARQWHDTHIHRDHTECCLAAWAPQMPALVNAYLAWCHELEQAPTTCSWFPADLPVWSMNTVNSFSELHVAPASPYHLMNYVTRLHHQVFPY